MSLNESLASLTSYNLIRPGRGSSLTPSHRHTDVSQFLSSGASSSRRPMDYRLYHTELGVRYYMDRLFQFRPEGVQYVLAAEIQTEGRDSVCPKSDTLALSWKSDSDILDCWKHMRFRFKQQLFLLKRERYGTPPITPSLSEMHADFRMEVAGAERVQGLQRQVEEWLCHIPGKLCTPLTEANLNSNSR